MIILVFKKLYDKSLACWKYKDNITWLRSISKHKEYERIIWGIPNDSVILILILHPA